MFDRALPLQSDSLFFLVFSKQGWRFPVLITNTSGLPEASDGHVTRKQADCKLRTRIELSYLGRAAFATSPSLRWQDGFPACQGYFGQRVE